MKRFTEKRPRGRAWTELPYPYPSPDGVARHRRGESAWRKDGVLVLSELVMALMPDGRGSGLQWHISMSHSGARPSVSEASAALAAFGMTEAEEDNHHPGVARHYFLVVDPRRRVTCECKAEEVTVRDGDGYRWTTPAEGEGECRGCEYERLTGKPCPVHTATGAAR